MLYQAPFPPKDLYTKNVLHPNNFTRWKLLHLKPFDTRGILHQGHLAIFFTKKIVHETFLHQKTCTPNFAYIHHRLFTPKTFAREPRHIRNLLQQRHFATRTFLHQTTFTAESHAHTHTQEPFHEIFVNLEAICIKGFLSWIFFASNDVCALQRKFFT